MNNEFFTQDTTQKRRKKLLLKGNLLGEQKETVLLLHGLGGTSSGGIARLADALYQNGHSSFRFDFAGHGQSAQEVKYRTPTQNLCDIASATEFLREQGKTVRTIVGNSYGGHLAAQTAEILEASQVFLHSPVFDYQILKETTDIEVSGEIMRVPGPEGMIELPVQFANDATRNAEEDVRNARSTQFTIYHARDDEYRQFRASQRLSKLEHVTLIPYKTGGHRLKAQYPEIIQHICNTLNTTQAAREPRRD